MTPEQFCYWLQGRAELRPDEAPTPEEWKVIREHLATVFHKVTPPLGDGIRKEGPNHHITPNWPYPVFPVPGSAGDAISRRLQQAIC